MGKYFFLFLSLLSGMIELGSIVYGIKMNFSILEIAGLGLAYQIGNLVPNPFKLNKNATIIISIISTCFYIAILFTKQYWILFSGFALIAMIVQSLRTSYKQKVHTALKRSSRIIGFFLAPFVSIPSTIVISTILVFGAIFSKYENKNFEFTKPKMRYIHLIMLMQQMHYFCYCYFVVIMIYKLAFTQNLAFSNLGFTSVCFALGWITYTWIPLLLKKDTYVKYYIISHVYLLAILLFMGIYHQSFILIILWILTGFGGGTGYCIEKIDLLDSNANSSDMIFIGNMGHILGVITGMLVFYVHNAMQSTLYLGAAFTLFATVMMAHYSFKSNNFKNIKN
jgi:hypothetical protein